MATPRILSFLESDFGSFNLYPLSKIIVAMAVAWLVGLVLRRIAIQTENEIVSQLSAMTLFAPMTVAVVRTGWRTRIGWREASFLSLVVLSSFVAWNCIMLVDPSTRGCRNRRAKKQTIEHTKPIVSALTGGLLLNVPWNVIATMIRSRWFS